MSPLDSTPTSDELMSWEDLKALTAANAARAEKLLARTSTTTVGSAHISWEDLKALTAANAARAEKLLARTSTINRGSVDITPSPVASAPASPPRATNPVAAPLTTTPAAAAAPSISVAAAGNGAARAVPDADGIQLTCTPPVDHKEIMNKMATNVWFDCAFSHGARQMFGEITRKASDPAVIDLVTGRSTTRLRHSSSHFQGQGVPLPATAVRVPPRPPDWPETTQYYLETGTCKFGATCKFHHPREKECVYYLRTGQCKFACTSANAKPEEFAAMRAQADAQISYSLSGAKMLKQQGNELHSRGKYTDAAAKYKLAKDNMKSVPSAAGRTLQLQCTLNLMSCYLKSKKFEEYVNEGSEVLTYDSTNVKAYYRRGQAYKELGNLQVAVADLSKAHEISPENETIAEIDHGAANAVPHMDVPLTTKSPSTCSTYVPTGTQEGSVADAVQLMSEYELINDVGGVSLFLEPCVEPAEVVFSESYLMEQLLAGRVNRHWDPGGSRYVCWLLNNNQFAGIIKVSFMNMLLDLNGNVLVDAMADIGKLSTFIQLAQQSVNLLVINELSNCTFVLLYAMSTFTTYLGNSGIGVARHVFNNMPAWRRNAFSPGHSAIRGDHLLLESIQSRGRSAFSLGQYGIGGVQYVVDKLPSSSRNAFNPGNSVMQASSEMWFSFFSQCHTTHFSARNWDPGIALTKSKDQLTILILQWFRFSTWLRLLCGCWPNGGRNYSLYQLLGHNLSLTEQPQLHMIGVVGPTKEQDCSNSAMTATNMRPTHITNWLVQMEIKCPNHILRFSQLLANGILLLLFFLVILKAEFKEANHNDWS